MAGKAGEPSSRWSRWKHISIISCIGVVVVAVAVLVGYAIARSAPPQHAAAASVAAGGGSSSSSNSSAWKELPPPGSADAQRLLGSADTPGWVKELYVYQGDSSLITADATRAFLQLLQQHLNDAAAAANSSRARLQQQQQQQQQGVLVPSGGAIDVEPFVRVARDVLSYLRASRSSALLGLLRGFSASASGQLPLEDVDVDELRAEVVLLLNTSRLERWYSARTARDGGDDTARVGRQAAPGRRRLCRHGRGPAAPRKLLDAASGNGDMASVLLAHMTGSGGSAAAAGAADAGTGATADRLIEEMLCSIRSFRPMPGLQDITCRTATPPPAGMYASPPRPFQPVRIPIVFHCLRFSSPENLLLPPLWGDAAAMAQNIVKRANELYQAADAGVEFFVQEVRQNPAMYAYLSRGGLSAWQACTISGGRSRAGQACLSRLARRPEVEELAQRHVINVFVAGSSQASFCASSSADSSAPNLMRRRLHGADASGAACASLVLGDTNAPGPWWSQPSPDWSEDDASANWVFLSWDQFNSATANDQRFWNGGACTLAHELGHYLALRHTHDGEAPCSGENDGVPDTAPNLRVDEFAAGKGLLTKLAGWCGDWREGREPPVAELQPYRSCNNASVLDNVFNVMSYTPDACCMVLTRQQVARLHWAIASYRPKMMAAYATAARH